MRARQVKYFRKKAETLERENRRLKKSVLYLTNLMGDLTAGSFDPAQV